MSEFNQQPSLIETRAAYTEDAHRPDGVLHRIASSAVEESELNHHHVGDVILPPKRLDEKYEARWELLEGAAGIIIEGAETEREAILSLAEQLDLRKPESIDQADLARIDPYYDHAVWMVEGGANRTSVVRRQLAIDAMVAVYRERTSSQTLYQFGSDRPIPKMKFNKETEHDEPNTEYRIAQEIAGDYLPEEDTLTEFDLNVASALQAGYEITDYRRYGKHDWSQVSDRWLVLEKTSMPKLIIVQPYKDKGGLTDGINAVYEHIMADNAGRFIAEPHFQPVVVTNGQYRAKDELQADMWARGKGINIFPPVALGDEPGYTVVHNGKEIATAERPPMVYVNEMVILRRLNSQA